MKKKYFKIYSAFALFTQLGFNMAIPIIVGVVIGKYIDKKFNLNNIFLILFLLIGIFSGFVINYRQIMAVTKQEIKQINNNKLDDEKSDE
jgi:F0F1-type ATP synthase assembly protein I